MTTLALGLVGAAVGGVVGSPGIGFTLGSALGQAVLGGKRQNSTTVQEGTRLSDLKVQSSQPGLVIPRVYGTYRLAGNLIWSTDLIETKQTFSQTVPLGSSGKGGQHGAPTATTITTSFSYSVSFALGLCQGVICGIRRIWADGRLIYSTSSLASTATLIGSQFRAKHIRIYHGSEDQLPDPLLEAYLGAGGVPAFRGLAYLVFEELALLEFANRLPNLTVEVVQQGTFTRNLAQPLVEVTQHPSEPVGGFCAVDGGVMHTRVAGHVPQRVDVDLKLQVIQRFVGTPVPLPSSRFMQEPPKESYEPRIKYMPNLFYATHTGQWYDVTTGETTPALTQYGQPLIGFYQQPHAYCLYTSGLELVWVQYRVTGACDLPRSVVHTIRHVGERFKAKPVAPASTPDHPTSLPKSIAQPAPNHETPLQPQVVSYDVVDGDCQHGYFFVTLTENGHPKLVAFDLDSLQLVKKWALHLEDLSGLPPLRLNPVRYAISLNPDSTAALFTRQDATHSVAFFAVIDFSQDTLVADPNDHYALAGQGNFCFVSDHVVYAGGRSSHDQSIAQLCGVHAIEPSLPTVADIVVDLCQMAGLGEDILDVSQLRTIHQPLDESSPHTITTRHFDVNGWVISQVASLHDVLLPLQQAYAFDLVESGFQLKAIPRGHTEPIVITAAELACEATQASPTWRETRTAPDDLPQAITVLFADIDADYQQGHQLAQRMRADVAHTQTQTVELAMALNAAQAQHTAALLLYQAWAERTQLALTVSRRYAHLDPGDVVGWEGQSWRLTSVSYGDPGLVHLTAVAENVAIYRQRRLPPLSPAQNAVAQHDVPLPSPTTLFLLDTPILHDAHDDTGFYVAVSPLLPTWSGALVARSIDEGLQFHALTSQTHAATTGITQNALAKASSTIWDEHSVLSVKLTYGELASVTAIDCLNGANLCRVGQEYLQFQEARLQSDGSYQLRRFLRGRYGTEAAIDTHLISERFILVDTTTWQRVAAADIGLMRCYIAITFGRTLAESATQVFTHHAIGKKPLSPVHLSDSFNSEGDLTITWVSRTRIDGTWRDHVDAAKDPEITGYGVEIQIVKEPVMMRTLTTSIESVTYTLTQQNEDGLSRPTALRITIYPIGRTVGKGFAAEINVELPAPMPP